MADVTFTVDGKKLTAPAGTLLIEACREASIAVPQFCYYPGLSLQAACRMCLVRLEKVPKLQTACTTPVTEGMVVTTESEEIIQARKATIELLLGNHPLDCPVCDAGGECELQDMTFKYGPPESLYTEVKQHRDEQQWSPVVFFDRPRCILCSLVRTCGEGMARGGARSTESRCHQHHCPQRRRSPGLRRVRHVHRRLSRGGAHFRRLSLQDPPLGDESRLHRLHPLRDGCKTTLGVRSVINGSEILRGDNRDKSGINGDFLCIKGRYAFDFANHTDRLTKPLLRQADGKFAEVSWEQALQHAGTRLREIRESRGGNTIGVIGSNRTTNEENYLLQKLARTVLRTNNIDHHRTADYTAFARAISAQKDRAAGLRETMTAPAILVLGNDPTEQHPLLAWNLRTNVRHHNARVYLVNHAGIKLERQAHQSLIIPQDGYANAVRFLGGEDSAFPGPQMGDEAKKFREALRAEPGLLIIFGSEYRGRDIEALVNFGMGLPHARFACLGDYVNSRGAADMGLLPGMLPGYVPVAQGGPFAEEYGEALPATPGMDLVEMFDAAERGDLAALYVVGANPVARYGIDPAALKNTFIVVQDMFLTETALLADVVLPTSNLYEKAGTVTNTYGDQQLVKKAADRAGVRSDFELMVRLADCMGADPKKLVPFGRGVHADMGQTRGAQSGEADRHSVWLAAQNLEPKLSPFDPFAILDEIQRLVPGYQVSRMELLAGNDVHVQSSLVQIDAGPERHALILPAEDTLFTSGTLGRYSTVLHAVMESRTTSVVP